jgi:hypothetical protein
MKISILTVWYNEESLAELFCSHYSFAHKIYILMDSDTNDKSIDIVSKYKNTSIILIDLGNGMNDALKQDAINHFISLPIDYDWFYSVDADEFIEPPNNESHQNFLRRQQGNLCFARMFQVYRHKSDFDIDVNTLPLLQRRYGDPNTTNGRNSRYKKPIVVKKGLNIKWNPGCHFFQMNDDILVSQEELIGAHWAMADPKLAIERRMKNKRRQSKHNLENNYSLHNHNITEDEILKECDLWKNEGVRVL